MFLLIVFAAACACASAEDVELCPIDKICPAGSYLVQEKNSACKTRMCSHEAPPAPDIDCHGGPTFFTCEAWPRDAGLEYQWAGGGVTVGIPGWIRSPVQSVACAHRFGNVRVSVRSPFGLESMADLWIDCETGRLPE